MTPPPEAPRQAPRVAVIGVGQPLRGDDGAGPAVLCALAGRLPPWVELHHSVGDPGELVERFRGAELVLVVDAASSRAPAGTIHRFDAAACPLPAGVGARSTHGLGLAASVELARALGRLPRRILVLAIEGGSFSASAPIEPAVRAAVAAVADEIVRLVGDPRRR